MIDSPEPDNNPTPEVALKRCLRHIRSFLHHINIIKPQLICRALKGPSPNVTYGPLTEWGDLEDCALIPRC